MSGRNNDDDEDDDDGDSRSDRGGATFEHEAGDWIDEDEEEVDDDVDK